MGTQKLLRLSNRFEPSHHSLSHPSRLMGLLSPVVGILGIIMNNIGHQLTTSNAIAAQFICHNLSGLITMAPQ
jgi:hypothetical protein